MCADAISPSGPLSTPRPTAQPQQPQGAKPTAAGPAATPAAAGPKLSGDTSSLQGGTGKSTSSDAVTAKAKADTDAAMANYDGNKDGKIDDKELSKWINEKGGDKQVTKDFTDGNQDGALDKREIQGAYERQAGRERLAELAKETDDKQTNENG